MVQTCDLPEIESEFQHLSQLIHSISIAKPLIFFENKTGVNKKILQAIKVTNTQHVLKRPVSKSGVRGNSRKF